MNPAKEKRLRARGWNVGSVEDLVDLTPARLALIKTKAALAERIRTERVRRGLSQKQLATRLGVTQPRVAQMEQAAVHVSLEALFQALVALGKTPAQAWRAMVAAN